MTDWASKSTRDSVRWTKGDVACSSDRCHVCLECKKKKKNTGSSIPVLIVFSCRKCRPSLTKTNKYFIQCIMCAVWSTREREGGRPHEGICFEFLMTLLLTLLALSHREENAQGCYATESNIYFNTPFLPLFPSLPFCLSPPIFSLSHRHIEHCPPHKHTDRKDSSPILRAHSSMRSLFSGCVVPEVAILPWPPLLLSKPCNQCAALCTRMSQDAPAKKHSRISDERQWLRVRLIRSCSCRFPLMWGLLKQIKSLQFGTFFLAATKQLLDQYTKLVEKKKRKNRKPSTTNRACWKQFVEITDCQESVHSWGYYWMFPCRWPKDLM